MLIYNKLTHPILAQFMQACKIFIDVLRDDTMLTFIERWMWIGENFFKFLNHIHAQA